MFVYRPFRFSLSHPAPLKACSQATIDREHSLSFKGVGHNKTITESVRLENGPKFPCVS